MYLFKHFYIQSQNSFLRNLSWFTKFTVIKNADHLSWHIAAKGFCLNSLPFECFKLKYLIISTSVLLPMIDGHNSRCSHVFFPNKIMLDIKHCFQLFLYTVCNLSICGSLSQQGLRAHFLHLYLADWPLRQVQYEQMAHTGLSPALHSEGLNESYLHFSISKNRRE